MAEAKQDINNASSHSRLVLAKPRLGGFGSTSLGGSGASKNNTFNSVLRPSQLKPGNNPFLKVTNSNDSASPGDKITGIERQVETAKEHQEVETPKFVPLGTANSNPRTSNLVQTSTKPTTSSSAAFVFGQNLSERVVVKDNINNGEESSSLDHISTNGNADLLFTNVAASVKDNKDELRSSENSSSGDGLAAAAAEYERSHARPPPPATTFNTTGEEGEINVLQISCRFFAWEARSWRERGRGMLRLNDAADGSGAARLVGRVAGSLRVVLNTKLWPDMVVERAGTKSLRISAFDAQQQVKLYLIMGAPGDIIQLHKSLVSRALGSKQVKRNDTKQHSSQTAAERLEADTDVSDYIEKPDPLHSDQDEQVQSISGDVEVESCAKNCRLNVDSEQKTDKEDKSSVDNEESKALKRKEPVEGHTSPKRQCPKILLE